MTIYILKICKIIFVTLNLKFIHSTNVFGCCRKWTFIKNICCHPCSTLFLFFLRQNPAADQFPIKSEIRRYFPPPSTIVLKMILSRAGPHHIQKDNRKITNEKGHIDPFIHAKVSNLPIPFPPPPLDDGKLSYF